MVKERKHNIKISPWYVDCHDHIFEVRYETSNGRDILIESFCTFKAANLYVKERILKDSKETKVV